MNSIKYTVEFRPNSDKYWRLNDKLHREDGPAEGRQIRQAFIVPKGQVMVAADYSQIELRIMAHLSKDEGLLSAFAAGQDVHKATAAEVFGVTVNEVTNDQRRSAKAINFGT